MRTIQNLKAEDKKVLVRVDFNVPLDEGGNILDDFRISSAVPTIKHLQKIGAKVILMSHLGKPKGNKSSKYSLRKVAPILKEELKSKVTFLSDCVGKEVKEEIDAMKPGNVILLENLRFHKGEEENNPIFVKKLASLADFYINNAFSASHREHASIVGLPTLLPRFGGLLLEKEINSLSKVKTDPKRPLVVLIGGKKPAKIERLKEFLQMADFVLVNGFLSEYILTAKRVLIREGFVNEEMEGFLKTIDLADPKLHLPKDVIFSLRDDWTYKRIGGLATTRREEGVFDIGPETIEIYSNIIKKAKTIFWAGPMGTFEIDRFKRGTKEIGDKITRNHTAFKVAGGGDTISAIKKFGLLDRFNHVSTGGSAMLKFLSGEELPGIEVL